MTPAVIERAAARLADGGWRYTPRQLYYAVCTDLEKPRRGARSVATGEVGLGAVLILVALILIRFAIPFTILLALGLLLIVTGVAARPQRTPAPRVRVLALSFTEFMEQLGAVHEEGMLSNDELASNPGTSSAAKIAVACDTAETAGLVNANSRLLGVDGAVAVEAATLAPPEHEQQRVIALHDASPRGCALILDVKDQGIVAIDAGLRPFWVSSDANQVLEGAPARLPRDLSSVLTSDEIGWLASGRRVELATLNSSEIAQLIQRAAGKLA
jgi:hypothetical protein